MFDWANLIVSVLTMVGTIAAVVVALWLYWASQRPEVIAYLSHDRDNGCVLFIVENVGKGVAEEVRFESFDFEQVQDQYREFVRERSFLTHGIPVLVSGESRSTVVLSGPEIKDYGSVVSRVDISYKRKRFGRWNKTEKCEFALDYYSFAGSIYTKSDMHKLMMATEVIAGLRTKDNAK